MSARSALPRDAGAAAVPCREVSRAALVNRLRATRSQTVVAIVAPPGYGKSTLLEQWAARDARSFWFAPVAPDDSDAAGLVRIVSRAAGVELTRPSGRGTAWIWATAVPRLAAALQSVPKPFVLVLDDAHRLDVEAAAVVTALVRHVPKGSLIVLAGRAQPLPSLPRLRAAGDLLELGPEDLALTRREARALLQLLGAGVPEAELTELFDRTEGWAAGIRLAGLALQSRAQSEAAPGLGGYVEAECLAGLSEEEREFVRRTAILDRLSGPLCDAVLDRQGSSRVLESLEESHVLLVALDRDRGWFRYRQAVAEQLRRELEELEPSLVPELERRAAAWFEAHGDADRTLRHAWAAGDVQNFARVLDGSASALHNSGRNGVLLEWVGRLGQVTDLAAQPGTAVLAARLHAGRGEGAAADRCLAAAIRGTTAGRAEGKKRLRAWIRLVRAAMCPDGAESMLADADRALDDLPADDPWRPYGLLLLGTAHVLLGAPERADAILGRAVHSSRRLGATDTLVLALTQRALLANGDSERVRAGQLLDAAFETARRQGVEDYPPTALMLAAYARCELLHGHSPGAFAALQRAQQLAATLGRCLPWLAAQVRLELAHAYVTLRDPAAARAVLAELDDLLATGPPLGTLRRSRDALAAEVEELPTAAAGRSVGLTAAELRLVPMLATHLSFREIGARFFLSRNTVKTQAISVYRKLGASSRSEAVVQATSLGLIDPGGDADSLIQTG